MKNPYVDEILQSEPKVERIDDLFEQMHQMENELHRLKKKKKESKKGKRKKLKKQINRLEREQLELKKFLFYAFYQAQNQSTHTVRSTGWQDALVTSLPQAIDLATAVVNRLPVKRNSVLYLPEKK